MWMWPNARISVAPTRSLETNSPISASHARWIGPIAVRVNVPAGYAGDGWGSGSWSPRSGNALALGVDLLGRALASACTLFGVGEVQVQNEQHKLKGTVWPEADEAAFKAKITHRQEALRTPAPAFPALPLRPRIATDTSDIPPSRPSHTNPHRPVLASAFSTRLCAQNFATCPVGSGGRLAMRTARDSRLSRVQVRGGGAPILRIGTPVGRRCHSAQRHAQGRPHHFT